MPKCLERREALSFKAGSMVAFLSTTAPKKVEEKKTWFVACGQLQSYLSRSRALIAYPLSLLQPSSNLDSPPPSPSRTRPLLRRRRSRRCPRSASLTCQRCDWICFCFPSLFLLSFRARSASGREQQELAFVFFFLLFVLTSTSTTATTTTTTTPFQTVLGIILGGGAGSRLYPLTKKRAKPAVPLGANYRLIDIPVSNCINSGVNKVYTLTQFNSASLNRHLAQAYNVNVGGYRSRGFVEVLAASQSVESKVSSFFVFCFLFFIFLLFEVEVEFFFFFFFSHPLSSFFISILTTSNNRPGSRARPTPCASTSGSSRRPSERAWRTT